MSKDMIQEYQDIGVEGLRDYMIRHEEHEYLLVDVRQPDEYAKGHIPGAVLIPLSEIPARMHELPVDKDIVFYCRSGKRSRAAAIFVGSQPQVAGTVFNMSGGMLVWDGQTLPAFPGLRTFNLTDSDDKILLRAMDLERGAERFYLALQQRYGGAAWGASLVELAGVEQAHARMIYRFWAVTRPNPPSFADIYASLTGEIVEGGFAGSDLLVLLEKQSANPCRSILEMALSIEYAAYDLSRNMAHRCQGSPLEAAFTAIAEGEKEHMALLASALGLCQGQ